MADVEQPDTWKSRTVKKIISALRLVKAYILIPDELILWIFWLVPLSRRIMRSEHPGILYVSAPPNSSLIIGVLLKKLLRLPLVCDIRDDWTDNPLMEKKNRLLRWWEKKLEAWVAHTSDRIVLVTGSSHELWNRRYPGCEHRFFMIPNGYSEEEFATSSSFRFEGFALVHVGSLELNRSPELVYRALSRISRTETAIGFYQYGLTLRKYRELAVRFGIEHIVHNEGTISTDQALARIKGASLLVLLPTADAPTAIPGKAYEYLRTGKPILMVSEENSTTAFMKQFPGVYHVLPDDEERCFSIIYRIYKERNGPVMIRSDEAFKNYDRKKLTTLLARQLNSLHQHENTAERTLEKY